VASTQVRVPVMLSKVNKDSEKFSKYLMLNKWVSASGGLVDFDLTFMKYPIILITQILCYFIAEKCNVGNF
jgi:hypothetical protein